MSNLARSYTRKLPVPRENMLNLKMERRSRWDYKQEKVVTRELFSLHVQFSTKRYQLVRARGGENPIKLNLIYT